MSESKFPAVGVWTGALDNVPISLAREIASEIETLGFGILWIPEVAARDVFVHLTQLLSATTTLIGATGVANIWARDAVAMSCAEKALAESFPGRFLLGLGVSHRNLVEDVRGHAYSKPVQAMCDYLDAMDSAPYMAVRPVEATARMLAALGPRMLALAAERTTGAHTYFVPPEHTVIARETLGPGPLLCPEQMVLVEPDPAAARDTARRHLRPYLDLPNYVNNLRRLGYSEEDFRSGGTDRLVDSIVAWGTVDDVSARVRQHFDAGADHVCIQALPADRRGLPIDQWREIAPALVELRPTDR